MCAYRIHTTCTTIHVFLYTITKDEFCMNSFLHVVVRFFDRRTAYCTSMHTVCVCTCNIRVLMYCNVTFID